MTEEDPTGRAQSQSDCGCSRVLTPDYEIRAGRRRFMLDGLAAMGGLTAAMTLPVGFSPAHAETHPVLRIGYLPITDATSLLTAYAMGYYQDEGVQAEKPELIRSWSSLVEGFARDRFNLVHLLKPIPVWMRYNNDFPVKIMAWAHVNGSGLVVGGRSDIESFVDLGGTQIAVPYWYSVHNTLLQMALRKAGLEPVIQAQEAPLGPQQVNLLILPPPEMPASLAAGQIDGYIVAEPFNAAGELLAGGRLLRFTGDMWENHPCCVVCMHEHQVSANPQWTQRVINAVVRGAQYAQNHKAEVAEMLSRDGEGYLPMPAEVVRRAMTHYDTPEYRETGAVQHPDWATGRIDFSPYPYPSATKRLVREMNQTLVEGDQTFLNGLDPEFVADDLVDYRFIDEALRRYPEADYLGSRKRRERLAL
ncbi:ABC transporter substrate-binding protein [Spiribacter insolitus]|uniref:ABC transporter substrate-binding protein n=1 Tax=Spiribacter insolitus TaxID=3122417 RepID=A0ABV3T805_9GAMM